MGLSHRSVLRSHFETVLTLLHDSQANPSHITEIVSPDLPHYYGSTDAAKAGAGGVWLPCTHWIQPTVWRLDWPEDIQQALDHFDNFPKIRDNLLGVSAKIKRPRAVTVRFLNVDGEVQERDFVGLWATSVQHQIDHLNGRLYFDRLSKVKRDMLLRKARKVLN